MKTLFRHELVFWTDHDLGEHPIGFDLADILNNNKVWFEDWDTIEVTDPDVVYALPEEEVTAFFGIEELRNNITITTNRIE